MQAVPLTTRSLALVEAAVAAAAVMAGVIALAKWWAMVKAETAMVPLGLLIAADVFAGVTWAIDTGTFRWRVLVGGLTRKVMIVVAVLGTFALQRLDPRLDAIWLGHWATVGLAAREAKSFYELLRKFGIDLPVLSWAVDRIDALIEQATFTTKKQHRREEHCENAKAVGRFETQVEMAREYVESGEVKPPTAVLDVIDQEYRDSGIIGTKPENDRRDNIHP